MVHVYRSPTPQHNWISSVMELFIQSFNPQKITYHSESSKQQTTRSPCWQVYDVPSNRTPTENASRITRMASLWCSTEKISATAILWFMSKCIVLNKNSKFSKDHNIIQSCLSWGFYPFLCQTIDSDIHKKKKNLLKTVCPSILFMNYEWSIHPPSFPSRADKSSNLQQDVLL